MRHPRVFDLRDTGADANRPGAVVRRYSRFVAMGSVSLVAVTLITAATPSRAQAVDINPLHWPGHLLGGITGPLTGVAVDAFDAIIRHLFAPIAKFVTTQLIGWLVAVPNFTQGNVSQLETTVCAMGGGLLGAVATISVARYWVAGFAGGGDAGFSALEGLTRTVGAALFLALWPSLFDTAVKLTNLFTSSLLGSGSVVDDTARLLAAGLGAGVGLQFTAIGLFLDIVVAVAASLLFLGLLLLKITVGVSTILVFVGMPLAVVLWPVAPWVARLAMRAFATCLGVPVLWSLCFAASAAVNVNVLSFKGGGGVIDTLVQPLVAIVLLWVMVKLPITLARIAMLGGSAVSGGFLSRAASHAIGSQMRDTARQHLPSLSGQETSRADQGSQRDAQTGGRLRNAATIAGATATGGASVAAATAASSSGAATGVTGALPRAANALSGRAYAPPPTAQAQTSGRELQNGLQTPSFAGRAQDFANETFEAEFRQRTSPVSSEQAKAALSGLPESTRRGIGQLVSDHGAGAREHLAYQAMGEWTSEQRDALRTLAAASPEVRSQAVKEALGNSDPAGTGENPEERRPTGAREQPASGPIGAANDNPVASHASSAYGESDDPPSDAQSPDSGPTEPLATIGEHHGDNDPAASTSSSATRSSQPATSSTEATKAGPAAESPSDAGSPARDQPRRPPPAREPRDPDPDTLFPNG